MKRRVVAGMICAMLGLAMVTGCTNGNGGNVGASQAEENRQAGKQDTESSKEQGKESGEEQNSGQKEDAGQEGSQGGSQENSAGQEGSQGGSQENGDGQNDSQGGSNENGAGQGGSQNGSQNDTGNGSQAGSADAQNDDELRESFQKALCEEAGIKEKKIAMFHMDDFDGDGKKEAFAITGESGDESDSVQEGVVWFVNENGCEKLLEAGGMEMSVFDREMKMGNTRYVMFDDAYVTSIVTYVFSVENGTPVSAPFSAAGQVITDMDGENRFRIMDSSYDCYLDGEIGSAIGHSWKHYYFFYDSWDNSIKEYAGTDIDDATAEYWCKYDVVGLCPEGDQIDSLFCRGNSLVVMNYEHKDGKNIEYYHYIYDFEQGCLVDDTRKATDKEPLPGVCRKALCPEIASYPQVPGPDGNVYGE